MTTLTSLTSATSSSALLSVLKDLKNSVIGNTWKKVEVAADEEVLAFLLQWVEVPSAPSSDPAALDIIVEIAVILGALANVGTLTLRPLLLSQAPSRLLHSIRATCTSASLSPADRARLLAALLRALRNVLIATADLVWGYMWGVSLQRKPVDTGLGGEVVDPEIGVKGRDKGKGKEVDRRESPKGSAATASEVLSMVFEPENLDTLLSLFNYSTNLQILLPTYQLLARLIALPSHREALARWTPPASRGTSDSRYPSPTPPSQRSRQPPVILVHLLHTISYAPSTVDQSTGFSGGSSATRRNPKLLEAALDLLAALVKGQPDLARIVRNWPGPRVEEGPWGPSLSAAEEDGGEGLVGDLLGIMKGAPTGVRIAAASCLTNLTKAEGEPRSIAEESNVRRGALNRNVLDVVVQLLKGEVMEDRIKLCFVLAALVSDDPALQKAAADRGCPTQLLGLYLKLDEEESRGELGADPASRAREVHPFPFFVSRKLIPQAILLALASLAFQTESTRSLIAEHTPSFLPYLLKALRHPSYGVRAAACQLARALSRCIAVLRTSLIDSGVADEVVELLRRECRRGDLGRFAGGDEGGAGGEGRMEEAPEGEEGDLGNSEERGWTVEVAAMGTICNLVPDFSPLRAKLLGNGGLTLLVSLTRSPHEPLALNALWAIKNLTFRAAEGTKSAVMAEMGYDHLKALMSPSIPNTLRVQAFSILRNLVADETPAELSRTTDAFGETELLDLVQAAVSDRDPEIRSAAIFTLSNLALGNERMRQALVSRVEIVEGLSDALNAKSDAVKHAAIRTLRHLIEASTRSRRPRQAMMELFHPYQLKTRLMELAEGATGFDVRHAAGGLVDVLERGRAEAGLGSSR